MIRRRVRTDNEISEMVTLELGGYPQKVLIEGRNRDLPVMIILHGGPGEPIPGCAFRGCYKDFTDRFITVFWDQLGCGINNRTIDDGFTVDAFVDMTEDLVGGIRRMFPNNQILLFATSWGSVLSAKLLERDGRAVDGCVVSGQLVRGILISDEVKDRLRRAGLSGKKMDRIDKVTQDDFTRDDLMTISRMLMRHTDAYRNSKGGKVPMGSFIKPLFTSPDYTLKDAFAVFFNGYRKNHSVWESLPLLDLTDSLKNVDVPYFILQGETDIVTSTSKVKETVGSIGNPNLEVRVVPDSGHLPTLRSLEAVMSAMDDLITRACSDKNR